MNNDNKLIFENYIDGVTKTKQALGGHIMSIVKHGIPSKEEFIKIRQELHDKVKEIQTRGTPATEEEKARGQEIIAKIKNYRSQHPNDPPPYNQEENAEGMSDKEYHKARKFGLEVAKEEVGKGPIKVQLTKDQALLCTRDGVEQEVKFVKGVVFNCDEWVGDYYHCESDKYGGVAVFPPDIKLINAPKGAITHLTDENAEDMSKSSFHYDPMTHLADAAHQINKILKSNSDDEARPEHIEKMAEIILGPQSEYSSVDHFKRALEGVIELLNRYIVVSMNEGEEMPEKEFLKLKQHINKGPLQIKKPSKELPYTHKYIHHLAKQDSREDQKEEQAEDICIEDLATKHGVGLDEIQKQLEMGIKVETEHTEDFDIAKKIALDHLSEDPNYYTKLAEMEGKSEDEERRLDPKCWKGYHKQGTKMKGGKRVNNCVKNEQQEDSYSRVAHDYAERIVGADVKDPKALAKHYLDNPDDIPEPLQYEVLKQNFEKILKYIDFTVGLNQRRKEEEEYKKKELEKGPIQPDPEVGLPGSKQARYKPHYKFNPADYLPRQ